MKKKDGNEKKYYSPHSESTFPAFLSTSNGYGVHPLSQGICIFDAGAIEKTLRPTTSRSVFGPMGIIRWSGDEDLPGSPYHTLEEVAMGMTGYG